MPPEPAGVLPSNAWPTTSIQQPLILLYVPSTAGPHPRLVASSLTPCVAQTGREQTTFKTQSWTLPTLLGLSFHSIGPWRPSAYEHLPVGFTITVKFQSGPSTGTVLRTSPPGPTCNSLTDYFPSPATFILPITTPATLSLTTPARPTSFSSPHSFPHRKPSRAARIPHMVQPSAQ